MLGSEYCSGYKDSSGEWNEGFYCPQPESKTANFCCGSSTFKFCCNAEIQDVILQDYGTDLETIVGQHPLELEEIPVIIGIIICGIILLIVLIIFISTYGYDFGLNQKKDCLTCCNNCCSTGFASAKCSSSSSNTSSSTTSASSSSSLSCCHVLNTKTRSASQSKVPKTNCTWLKAICPFLYSHQGVYHIQEPSSKSSNGHFTQTAKGEAETPTVYEWQTPATVTLPRELDDYQAKKPTTIGNTEIISISSPLIATINGISSFLEDQIKDLPNPTDFETPTRTNSKVNNNGAQQQQVHLNAMAMINSVPLPCYIHNHDEQDDVNLTTSNTLQGLDLNFPEFTHKTPAASTKPPVPPPRTRFGTFNYSKDQKPIVCPSPTQNVRYNSNNGAPYLIQKDRERIYSSSDNNSTRRRPNNTGQVPLSSAGTMPICNSSNQFLRGMIDLSPRISSTYPNATATLPLSPKFSHRTKTGNVIN